MHTPSEREWDDLPTPRAKSRWRGLYALSLLLIVLGVVIIPVTVVWQASRLFGPPRGWPTVRTPGTMTARIDGPGTFAVWNERRSIVEGWYQSTADETPIGAFTIAVTGPDGTSIPLDPMMRGGVGLGFVKRILLGGFHAPAAGPYTVAVSTTGSPGALVSVTPSPEAEGAIMGVAVLIAAMVALVAFLGGCGLLMVTIVRHVYSVRRARAGR